MGLSQSSQSEHIYNHQQRQEYNPEIGTLETSFETHPITILSSGRHYSEFKTLSLFIFILHENEMIIYSFMPGFLWSTLCLWDSSTKLCALLFLIVIKESVSLNEYITICLLVNIFSSGCFWRFSFCLWFLAVLLTNDFLSSFILFYSFSWFPSLSLPPSLYLEFS